VDEIGIYFSGLRLGEKLYEELLADADTTVPTQVHRLSVSKLKADDSTGTECLAWLADVWVVPLPASDDDVRQLLRRLVAEYIDPPR